MTSSTCSRRLRWFRRAVCASACALTTTSERAASQPVQERIIASQLQQVANLPGELEVAVSPDGRQRIIAVNGPRVPGFGAAVVFFWNEATASFRPGNPPLRMANQRDPTVAWAGSGDFYFATMETARNVAVSRSTDGGRNFTARSLNGDGRADPATGAGVCPVAGCTTDQPHIAADPRPHAAGADEVYLVWRNFAAGETAMIECSTDSGANWQNRQAISGAGGGQFPRVTVGPDGSVFALTVTNRNGGSILLQKFSPCSAGRRAPRRAVRSASASTLPARLANGPPSAA